MRLKFEAANLEEIAEHFTTQATETLGKLNRPYYIGKKEEAIIKAEAKVWEKAANIMRNVKLVATAKMQSQVKRK